MKPNELDRRAFVKVTGTAAGGMILLAACTQSTGRWRELTEAEASVVEAIAEQIIPADQHAGARDANVVNYIDRQLASVFAKHRETYRKGIAGVDETSRSMFAGEFQSLEWSQQTEVLQALERGDAKGEIWETESAQSFFRLIRDHTMQGFYGSPRHGGNEGFVSFRMIGLAYPTIIGQDRDTVFPNE